MRLFFWLFLNTQQSFCLFVCLPRRFKVFVQGAGQHRVLFPTANCRFGGLEDLPPWTHLHLLHVLFDSSPKSKREAAERGERAQQCGTGARHKLNHPVITIRGGVRHSQTHTNLARLPLCWCVLQTNLHSG